MQIRGSRLFFLLLAVLFLLYRCGDEAGEIINDAGLTDNSYADIESKDSADIEEIRDVESDSLIDSDGGSGDSNDSDISSGSDVSDPDLASDISDTGSEDVAGDIAEIIDDALPDISDTPDTESQDTFLDAGDISDAVTDTGVANYEARSVWVTRWDYEKSKSAGPQSIANIMKNIADANFNMVYFQVRGRADAYYKSSYEPWASDFTGTLGVDPGWDPLAIAVEEAHKNGLEIHIWVNTFTMWSGTTPPQESSPRHIYLSHPEWLVVDSNGNKMALNSSYVFATPGNPLVWDHIINVVTEIALKYNIDGIHFDYIRYPGPNYSYDTVSNTRFSEAKAKDSQLTRENWQRAQVTEFLSHAYENIISVKPMLKVTAAVWGIYRNKWNWTNVSQGYSDYYQDSQNWMKLGIVDAISPMIYWPMTDPPGQRTDYATLASDFLANSYSRFLFAGVHVYPRSDTDTYNFSEMSRQIEYLRQIGAEGLSVYNYALLKQNSYFDDLRNGPFKDKAFVPPMPWK